MESPSSNNSSSSPFSITNATNTGESKWLKAIGKSQSSSPKKRLFIFPHAGSNALYFIKWNFPSEVAAFAIQYPGRSTRLSEANFENIEQYSEALLQDNMFISLISDQSVPFEFFGHSFGCNVAFEVALALQRAKYNLPQHLWISSKGPPSAKHDFKGLKSDEELISLLKFFGGTPKEILENKKMLEIILPPLRSDFAASEKYWRPNSVLNVRISCFLGTNDIKRERVEEWKLHTSQTFEIKEVFPGNHFYFEDPANQTKLIGYLSQ